MSTVAPDRGDTADRRWDGLDPSRARRLVDARLQFHHAAQLATAAGISFLAAEADDSHTNLEWLAQRRALASRVIPARTPFRVAVRPGDLTLLALDADDRCIDEIALGGRTLVEAAEWVRVHVVRFGTDGARYTLRRHYVIPEHPVISGNPFDATARDDFSALADWFDDADLVLRALASQAADAGPVRCWPHHFDIATLITLEPIDGERSRTIGAGLEPGDEYYAEPYFYVNLHPTPNASVLPALGGGGVWHTAGWTGAVLPATALTPDGTQQLAQVDEFLTSGTNACRLLLA